MAILRDEWNQTARSIHDGAALPGVYVMSRMRMGKLGTLLRSWAIEQRPITPLIVILDSVAGIIAPPKCFEDGPGYRNWWTVGKHLLTMLTVMQESIDLQPFPIPIALVVLLSDVAYEGLAEEYREALDALFPVAYAR